MIRQRCAIYTRKSTEDGLEQDFNSLDAQREACEAYVLSQKSEGWAFMPDIYDDGGYSGGNMDRPGLQRLMADVAAGKIDIVVVYKVDRLTRSLMDFSQIVQRLDKKDVSFVSVTQSFNTTTSMGRLTLNVLLSFAQFEREVTAERIRDKIAASKKKGMWMGGVVPLGYDVKDRQLIVNEQEARTVRWIYETYLDLKCVRLLMAAADRHGFHSKGRVYKEDGIKQSRPLSRGQIYNILQNPLYIGKIHHQGQHYDGQHKGIIPLQLWDRAQALRHHFGIRKAARNMPTTSWLTRILKDSSGGPMVAEHTTKSGRRYRYYVSTSVAGTKRDNEQGWRLPAKEIEAISLSGLRMLLQDPVALARELGVPTLTAQILAPLTRSAQHLLQSVAISPTNVSLLRSLIHEVRISLHEVVIDFNGSELNQRLGLPGNYPAPPDPTIALPVQLKRRGVELRLVIPGREKETTQRDEALMKLVAKAHIWVDQLTSGRIKTINTIAETENMDIGDVSRILPLAFLAPDIIRAVVDGDQPIDVTVHKLKRLPDLPIDWRTQRALLGFPAIN